MKSASPPETDITEREGEVRKVPNSDIADATRSNKQAVKEKAARRRLLNSNLIIVDQAAINAGFDFRR
jgi:hypothetical protein